MDYLLLKLLNLPSFHTHTHTHFKAISLQQEHGIVHLEKVQVLWYIIPVEAGTHEIRELRGAPHKVHRVITRVKSKERAMELKGSAQMIRGRYVASCSSSTLCNF